MAQHRKATSVFLLAIALLGAGTPAKSSILTFDINDTDPKYALTENFPEGYAVPQEYGDRVNSASQISGTATFGYGVGAEGYTPNVVVEYGPSSIFTGGPSLWRYDYGDLTRVLYQGSTNTGIGNDYDYLTIVLRADFGYDAVLYGFDLGGWFETDYEVAAVSVYDADYNGFFPELNRVFHQTNAAVDGAGPTHSTFSFGTPIRGNVVTIFIDAANLGATSELIGIDNIRFGQDQSSSAVPEPGTVTMLAAGLGLFMLRARRRY